MKEYKAYHQYLALKGIDLGESTILYRNAKAEHVQCAIDDCESADQVELLTSILDHMKELEIERAGEAMVQMGLLESLDLEKLRVGSTSYERWIDMRDIATVAIAIDEPTSIEEMAEKVMLERWPGDEDMVSSSYEIEPLVKEFLERMNPDDKSALVEELNTQPLAA